MIERKRWRLTPAEKIDMWRRWKCGQSRHEIGRAHGRPHPTIRKWLLPTGGIAPAPRRRSRLALTLAEREDISRGIACDSSIREIAGLLERSASTVSREVVRHGGRPAYRAHDADRRARVLALRPKRCLLAGGKNSYIATLVERHSRFLLLIKVPSKDTAVGVAALSKRVRKLPATLRRSLTWDRGLQMAKHKEFTVATEVQVYFCDPQSPWQRGTNENTNLLLRQYFPRGTDLSSISQEQLHQIELLLNQRPRKTLGFHTPASKLQASVASTV
jgi:IS30 family transposase